MKRILAAVALTVCAAVSSQAMQNIKLGSMDLNPVVSVQETYDNNIYLTPSHATAAWINKTSFGLGLDQKLRQRLALHAFYGIDFLSYSRHPDSNDAVHHTAELTANLSLANGIQVVAGDKYLSTSDQATSEETQREKRVQNTAGFALEAPLKGALGFTADVRHVYNDYLSSGYGDLDRSEMLLGGGFTYKFQPKTRLLLNYHYGHLAYDKASEEYRDAKHHNVALGIEGELAQKVTGKVTADLQVRNYDQVYFGDSKRFSTGGFTVQLKWLADEASQVILTGARKNVESKYVNNRYYTSTSADVAWKHSVRKVDLNLALGYENTLYPQKNVLNGEKRSDGYARFSFGLDYNLQKWLKAGFAYGYKSRSSNSDNFDYEDNTVTFKVNGLF